MLLRASILGARKYFDNIDICILNAISILVFEPNKQITLSAYSDKINYNNVSVVVVIQA